MLKPPQTKADCPVVAPLGSLARTRELSDLLRLNHPYYRAIPRCASVAAVLQGPPARVGLAIWRYWWRGIRRIRAQALCSNLLRRVLSSGTHHGRTGNRSPARI